MLTEWKHAFAHGMFVQQRRDRGNTDRQGCRSQCLKHGK